MTESRREIDDEGLIAFLTRQLEKTAPDMRQLFYRRKERTEHVMAFIIVRQMRSAGWRVDAPPLGDGEGAVWGRAMPDAPTTRGGDGA